MQTQHWLLRPFAALHQRRRHIGPGETLCSGRVCFRRRQDARFAHSQHWPWPPWVTRYLHFTWFTVALCVCVCVCTEELPEPHPRWNSDMKSRQEKQCDQKWQQNVSQHSFFLLTWFRRCDKTLCRCAQVIMAGKILLFYSGVTVAKMLMFLCKQTRYCPLFLHACLFR